MEKTVFLVVSSFNNLKRIERFASCKLVLKYNINKFENTYLLLVLTRLSKVATSVVID